MPTKVSIKFEAVIDDAWLARQFISAITNIIKLFSKHPRVFISQKELLEIF